MSEAEIASLGDALETLVHQFSDPWSFLRELIQNSIDAGSAEIDVRVEYQDEHGTMMVEVCDSGEGMDRRIIDSRLTRLFSSAKDGDLTKIGRFGIGFVSVFAIDPDMVCVDTGRTGEYWRVLFQADRGFERIRLDTPVEGTTVRIYKRASESEAREARERARSVLEYWCKHARVEIRLEDELITMPMKLDGLCTIHHREEGTELVMAWTRDRQAMRGYYHGGLTLHEELDDTLPHVAFKIDSRYLEHTLTRDNVIRDENFSKAMQIVLREAEGKLMTALFERLVDLARRYDGVLDGDHALLCTCAAAHLEAGSSRHSPLLDLPVVPLIDGRICSLRDCREFASGGRYAGRMGDLVAMGLASEGQLVVRCRPGDELWALVVAATGEPLCSTSDWCTTGPLSGAGELERWRPLCEATGGQLAAQGYKVRQVGAGHLAYVDSPIAGRVAITQERIGERTAVAEIGELSSGWLSSGRALVFNADHPTVEHLRTLAAAEPELAGYLAIKLFFLHGELEPAVDSVMAGAAAEARWRRLES
jgi:hypothetical protein